MPITPVPIQPLDLTSARRALAPGAMVKCQDLIPEPERFLSGGEGLALRPVPGKTVRATLGAPALALHRYQHRSNAYLCAVTSTSIILVDETAYTTQTVHTFSSDRDGATFAQIGEELVVCATSATGLPEMVVLRGTLSLPWALPALPRVTIAVETTTDEDDVFTGGTYGLRFAWQLADGTLGPASRPYPVTAPMTTRYRVRCTISGFPSGVTISDYADVVNGLAVLVSEGLNTVDIEYNDEGEVTRIDTTMPGMVELVGASYFHVATIGGISTGKEVVFGSSAEAILSAPSYDEGHLLGHDTYPHAIFAYNGHLLMGDVLRDPIDPDLALDWTEGASAGTNSPPQWVSGATDTTYDWDTHPTTGIEYIAADTTDNEQVTVKVLDKPSAAYVEHYTGNSISGPWTPGEGYGFFHRVVVRWIPENLQQGIKYLFRFEAVDERGLSTIKDFYVTTPNESVLKNAPPFFTGSNQTLSVGVAHTSYFEAEDPEQINIDLWVLSKPSGSTTTIEAWNGSAWVADQDAYRKRVKFEWTPAITDQGGHFLQLEASDGIIRRDSDSNKVTPNIQSFSITVATVAGNTAPVISGDNIVYDAGKHAAGIYYYITDPDGDILSASNISGTDDSVSSGGNPWPSDATVSKEWWSDSNGTWAVDNPPSNQARIKFVVGTAVSTEVYYIKISASDGTDTTTAVFSVTIP